MSAFDEEGWSVKSTMNPIGTYLRIIYELEEAGVVPRRARIREQIDQSAATVGQTVDRMIRDGLVLDGAERQVELTDIGRARAVTLVRKQRLAACLLVDIVGLDPEMARVEARLWQHVISDRVERRIVELLDNPTVCPAGLPIPGMAQLRPAAPPADAPVTRSGADDPSVQRLDHFARYGGGTTEVCSIGDPSRSDPALHAQLASIGIHVGAVLTVSTLGRRDRPVSVRTAGASVELPTALARAVHVRAT